MQTCVNAQIEIDALCALYGEGFFFFYFLFSQKLWIENVEKDKRHKCDTFCLHMIK